MGCALWAPCKVRALWGSPQPQHKARKVTSELRVCCGVGATFCSTALLCRFCLRKSLLKLNCSRTNCSHECSEHSSNSSVHLSRMLCFGLCHSVTTITSWSCEGLMPAGIGGHLKSAGLENTQTRVIPLHFSAIHCFLFGTRSDAPHLSSCISSTF